MKTMFEFDIYHEKEIEKVDVSTNEKGEEVKTLKKVKEKSQIGRAHV